LGIFDPQGAGKGSTPVTRADGPSACPGDSSHERESIGKSDASWDMQQAAKSIRVRNAGVFLLLWRAAFNSEKEGSPAVCS
jgi:hypothetical protein